MLTRGICRAGAEAETGYVEHVAVGSTGRSGRPQTFFSLPLPLTTRRWMARRTSCGVRTRSRSRETVDTMQPFGFAAVWTVQNHIGCVTKGNICVLVAGVWKRRGTRHVAPNHLLGTVKSKRTKSRLRSCPADRH